MYKEKKIVKKKEYRKAYKKHHIHKSSRGQHVKNQYVKFIKQLKCVHGNYGSRISSRVQMQKISNSLCSLF